SSRDTNCAGRPPRERRPRQPTSRATRRPATSGSSSPAERPSGQRLRRPTRLGARLRLRARADARPRRCASHSEGLSRRIFQTNPPKERTMDARVDLADNPVGSKVVKYLVSANKVVSDSALPAATQELVKIRASQINGCGFCTDMHTKDAARAGET